MRKLNRLLVFVLIVGLLLSAVHIISAQQRGRADQRQRGQMDPAAMVARMLERALTGLNLSDEETTVIKPKAESILQTRMDQNREMRELTNDLREAVDAEDGKQIEAKLTALNLTMLDYKFKQVFSRV